MYSEREIARTLASVFMHSTVYSNTDKRAAVRHMAQNFSLEVLEAFEDEVDRRELEDIYATLAAEEDSLVAAEQERQMWGDE